MQTHRIPVPLPDATAWFPDALFFPDMPLLFHPRSRPQNIHRAELQIRQRDFFAFFQRLKNTPHIVRTAIIRSFPARMH